MISFDELSYYRMFDYPFNLDAVARRLHRFKELWMLSWVHSLTFEDVTLYIVPERPEVEFLWFKGFKPGATAPKFTAPGFMDTTHNWTVDFNANFPCVRCWQKTGMV